MRNIFATGPWLASSLLMSSAGALVLACPSQALAQDGRQEGRGDVLAIEEIIVTSQKREQSLHDVPISITAFSGDYVRDTGWLNPVDIIQQVPNFSGYSIFGNAVPQFFIRGIGTNDPGNASQSPVAVYVNEIYHSSLVGQGFSLFDLERVEVLRGPQGTLWGKNTTGGAVHFISALPEQEFGGYALAGFGLYNDDTPVYDFEGAVTGPLISNVLAARVAVKARIRENWISNEIGQSGPKRQRGLDGVNELAGRLTFQFTPSETFDAVLRASVGRRDGDHVPLHQLPLDNPSSFFRHGGFAEDPRLDRMSIDRPSPEDIEYELASLHMNLSTPIGTITSITGYVHSFYSQDVDVDGTPFDGLFGPFEADSDQFTQEIRLASPEDQALRWIVGGYYFQEDMRGFNMFLTGSELNNPPLEIFANSGFGSFETRDRSSKAIFGSAEYDFTEALTASVGLRFTRDSEKFNADQKFWAFVAPRTLDSVPEANNAVVIFEATGLKEGWSRLTGDATLTYAFSDDANVYAKYSRGYLGGNHILPFPGTARVDVVNPETVNAFEVGSKSTLLAQRLQLYAAFFYYDYKDIQVSRGVTGSAGETFTSIRENAAKSTVKGIEIEAKLVPAPNWFFSLGFGWTDAEFDEFLSARPDGTIDDRAGRPFPNVPEINWNALASYTFPLPSGAGLEFETNWYYQDRIFIDSNFRDGEFGEARHVGNVNIRYHAASGDWKLTAYARNVTDNRYIVNRRNFENAIEAALIIFGEPRVFGLNFDISF
ncbi:MAG: TonB-dependent receptor [Alphaproteobacteria bacterium]|nr:MAG: TonB-dependent receptor [Alphaproteobacteria bacterium]